MKMEVDGHSRCWQKDLDPLGVDHEVMVIEAGVEVEHSEQTIQHAAGVDGLPGTIEMQVAEVCSSDRLSKFLEDDVGCLADARSP